jgi:hypothetical protein
MTFLYDDVCAVAAASASTPRLDWPGEPRIAG